MVLFYSCLEPLVQFQMCTSLAPRPMIVVFDLGTRLRVRMRTFEKHQHFTQPAQCMLPFLVLVLVLHS